MYVAAGQKWLGHDNGTGDLPRTVSQRWPAYRVCTWLGPQEMASQGVDESACYEWHSYVRGYHNLQVFGYQL